MHKVTHRAKAAPAIHAIARVPVKPTARARPQLTLDIVREVLLRPLVVIATTGLTHSSPFAAQDWDLPFSR